MTTNKTPARKGIAHTMRFSHEPAIRTGIDMAAMPSRQAHSAMPTALLTAGDGGPGTTPMMGTVPEYPLMMWPYTKRMAAPRSAQATETFTQDGFLIFISSC